MSYKQTNGYLTLSQLTRSARVALMLAAMLGMMCSAQQAYGQGGSIQVLDEEEFNIPILERKDDPFDRIFLDAASGKNVVFETEPLFADDVPPSSPNPGDMLQFTWVRYPDRKLQVRWQHVDKIKTYPQLVLEEAISLLDKGSIPAAFTHFDFLLQHPRYKKTAGLQSAIKGYLLRDSIRMVKDKKFHIALSAIEELYRRDPSFKVSEDPRNSTQLMDFVLDEIIAIEIRRRDFRLAERIMDRIDRDYRDVFVKTTRKRRKEIESLALVHRETAIEAMKRKDGRAAHIAVRKMMNIAPNLEVGKQLQEEVLLKFPIVFVGVNQRASKFHPQSIDNWAARRAGRLFFRTMLEYRGQGEDGGDYGFPQGRITKHEDLKGLEFVIREKKAKPGLPVVDSYMIARRMLQMADRNSPEYAAGWARLLESVEVDNPQRLRVNFKQPHVLPEALLQILWEPEEKRSNTFKDFDNLYIPVKSDQPGSTYRYNTKYKDVDASQAQYPDLVELYYEDSETMIKALKHGDIDVIDRVFPAEIGRLRQDDELIVQPYKLPTVHMLIPNLEKEHMKNTAFRRAILYAIDRASILNDGLLNKYQVDGYQVVSGPFPIGLDENDPISYGYNFTVPNTTYEPRMASLLLITAEKMIKDKLEEDAAKETLETGVEKKAEKPPKRPTLVLAYPESDIAALACNLIKQRLSIVGVQVELDQLPRGITNPKDMTEEERKKRKPHDLLYAEVMIEEPLIGARRLLMDSQLVQLTEEHKAVEHALRQLDGAKSWVEVRTRLQDLHLQCSSQAILLPLFQVVEHSVYRRNLQGVGKEITSLYQNVNRWRIVPENEN